MYQTLRIFILVCCFAKKAEGTSLTRVKRLGNYGPYQAPQDQSWLQDPPLNYDPYQAQQGQVWQEEPQPNYDQYQEQQRPIAYPQAQQYATTQGSTVKYGPDGFAEIPIDVQPAGGIERSVGQTATFKCSSTKPGDKRVYWNRRASAMPSQAKISPDGTLTIPNLQPNDFGIYVCRSGSKDVMPLMVYIREAAPSPYGPGQQPQSSVYQYPVVPQYPQVQPDALPPQEPSYPYDTYQQPEQQPLQPQFPDQYPYWDGYGPKPAGYPKSGYPQPYPGQYTPAPVQYRPTTQYPGTTQVTARPPGVKTPPGTDASFECTCLVIPQNSYCDVSWTRPDNRSLPINSYVLQGKLTIKNVSDEDYGLYKCVSRQADRTITVILEKLPVTTSPGSQEGINASSPGGGLVTTQLGAGEFYSDDTIVPANATIAVSAGEATSSLAPTPTEPLTDTVAETNGTTPTIAEGGFTTPTEPSSTELTPLINETTTSVVVVVTTPTEPSTSEVTPGGGNNTTIVENTTEVTTVAAVTNQTDAEVEVTNEPTVAAISGTGVNETTGSVTVSEAVTTIAETSTENATTIAVPTTETTETPQVENVTQVIVANATTSVELTEVTTVVTTEFITEITSVLTVNETLPIVPAQNNVTSSEAVVTTLSSTTPDTTINGTAVTQPEVTSTEAATETSIVTTVLTSIITESSVVIQSPNVTQGTTEVVTEIGTTELPSSPTTAIAPPSTTAIQIEETTVIEGLVSPGIEGTPVPIARANQAALTTNPTISNNTTVAIGDIMVEPPGGIRAPMGDTVTFNCTCPSADPKNCRVNWSRPETGALNQNTIQGILTIRNISDTDYGAYKCTSEKSQYSVTVLVERPTN